MKLSDFKEIKKLTNGTSMGNWKQISNWLYKPTWEYFIYLTIGWAVVLGLFLFEIIYTFDNRSIWMTVLYVLILLLLYMLIFVSGYKHVRKYENTKNGEKTTTHKLR